MAKRDGPARMMTKHARRMSLTNNTRYDGRVLRRLIQWCIQYEGAEGRAAKRVTVVYATRGPSGAATVNGSWVKLRLGRGSCDGRDAARVLIHEIGHNLGLKHREMAYAWTLPLVNFPEDLAVLRERPVPERKPAATGLPLAERKLAHVRAKLAEWEAKERAAAKRVKHWRQKVRYHTKDTERRRAASPPQKEET